MDNKEKLLNKIRNLLDLADSKNSRHEAEAAAKKAQALIMKYNVEEAELHKGETADIEEVKYELYKIKRSNEGTWLRDLFNVYIQDNDVAKRVVRGIINELRAEL